MKSALIIIDMQKGFINDNTKDLPAKIVDFVNKNRDKFEVIISTAYINHKNTACYIFENWTECMSGSEEVEILDEIKNITDIFIEKDVYSCYSLNLELLLRDKGIEKLYFCGVNTGCCVLHSVFDFYNLLYDSSVISDLCASTSGKLSHQAAIQVLSECITKQRIITSTQFEEMNA